MSSVNFSLGRIKNNCSNTFYSFIYIYIYIYDPEVEKWDPFKAAFPRRHVNQYDKAQKIE